MIINFTEKRLFKMSTKYIFVTGGVVSGLGKGITAASLGRLLKARGLRVTMQKLDPYFNIDPGTMNPIQHGEVFVTDDGAETDLDLGHYERFIDENLNSSSNATSGKMYNNVLKRERRGDYNGGTVQIIPHITREIQEYIAMNKQNADIAIIEIGGTVGDIESQAFLEAIRQFSNTIGRNNCLFIHVTLLVYLAASKEHKTKPTQHSVKELLRVGIQPDIIVLRSERPFDPSIKGKIATFCNIKEENVIANLDVPLLYEAPLFLKGEKLDDIVCKYFGFDVNAPQDLSDWIEMVNTAKSLTESVRIAMVGKYTALHDSYISVVEALKHGGFGNKVDIDIKWIDSDTIDESNVAEMLGDVDGILVPGGFGVRGIEGMILAANYARTNNVPYLGICLGMQIAMIEFARNVLGFRDANSMEFKNDTTHAVIDLMPEQKNVTELGATMRRGKYPCKLLPGSKVHECYGTDLIEERHRHRYEVNNIYRGEYERKGLVFSGQAPDGHVVEMIELPDHMWFVACQFHPEFKSRPNRPHPLFKSFIEAAKKNRDK